MTLEGVKGPTHHTRMRGEVRDDHFGKMTDAEVMEYKKARPGRYGHELLEARVTALEGEK